MTDEIETPAAAGEAAAPGDDAPASSSAAQAARVAQLLAAQRAPVDAAPAATTTPAAPAAAKRGPGRPRADGSTPPAGEKRKKPSGRKPTRAELAAKLKELQTSRAAAQPAAASAPNGPAQPSAPSGLHRPEVKARFAAGVAKIATQGGRFMAARRGDHWKMEALEANALGEASADAVECIEELAPSLAPYIGKVVQLAPLGIFAAVLFGILVERMEKDAEMQARRDRGEPTTGDCVAVVPREQMRVAH